jgi:DNA-binding Lrp family transcriptional regulator
MGINIGPLSNDWAVLCQLEYRARATYAEIGRLIGISKENVKNATRRLEQRGIISNYFAVIDVSRLGLTPYVVYAQLTAASQNERDLIIRKLCAHRNIYWVSRMGGKFDILFGLLAATVREFHDQLNGIQKDLGSQFGRLAISTRLQTIQFPRNYLSRRAPSRTGVKTKKPLTFGGDLGSIEISNRERTVVNAISGNARESTVGLAQQLKMPRTSVQRLLNDLEQKGIICGYAANVHAEALGYQIYRLLINTRRKDTSVANAIYRFAREHDNIIYLDFGIGEWDIELTCEVKDSFGLQEIFSQLQTEFANQMSSIELLSVFEDNVKFQFSV